MNKIFKIIKMIFNFIIFGLVLSFVFVVCLQRFSNNEISFLDYRIFTVISGSMDPKYSIGDVLLAKEVKPWDIEVGDEVSYLGDKGQFNNKVVTHDVVRVLKCTNIGDVIGTASDDNIGISYLSESDKKTCISVYGELNNKYIFETKGVANLTSDPLVKEDQLYGKIVRKNYVLTFVYGLVSKPTGMLLFVIVPLFYIIGSEFLSFLLEKEEERREKSVKNEEKNIEEVSEEKENIKKDKKSSNEKIKKNNNKKKDNLKK